MATRLSHTRGDHRLCQCGNKISGKDTHRVCSTCLGVDHARLALDVPGSCEHCKAFTVMSLRRRLARQASLSDNDPFLPAAGLGSAAEVDNVMVVDVPETDCDWGSQVERFQASSYSEEDVLEVDADDDDTSFLISEDEEEDDIFVAPAPAAKPKLPAASKGGDEASTPAPSLQADLLVMCKRAADKLDIPWPVAVAEPTRSRYEGKRLPLARSAVKQLLPVFPELLSELSRSWKSSPFSGKSPVPGAASLDCEAMDALGLLSMPPVEAPVAAHLCPGSAGQLSSGSSRRPTLPTKPERSQSLLTERAYKAAALSARALNALSILTAYQAELFGVCADQQDPDAWEEIAVITDLCLRIQRVSVQATGKVMATLVVQERARWLNLANLTDREREDVLDMPVVPDGIFGPALANMQQRCEAKKKDNEALNLCLPRKAPAPSPPVRRKTFAQAATQPPSFKVPKRPQHQPAPSFPPRKEPGSGWPKKSPPVTAASPTPGPQAAVPQVRKKKRSA